MADQEIKLKLNGDASGAKKAAAEARIAIGQMNIAISKQSNEINNNIAQLSQSIQQVTENTKISIAQIERASGANGRIVVNMA